MQAHSRNLVVHYAILGFIYLIGFATLFGHTTLHAFTQREHTHSNSHVLASGECLDSAGRVHELTITDTEITPVSLSVGRCDEIRIKNTSAEPVIPALGSHDNHTQYPGFRETILQPHEAYEFRVRTAGTFVLHNHNNAELSTRLEIRE